MIRKSREGSGRWNGEEVSSDSGNVDLEASDKKPLLKKSANPDTMQNLQGDHHSIALLLLLYTLQGVPMGLASIVPLLLQENGASYTDQGLYSLVSWPFSLKLLWAPIVDGFFHAQFGRRKSWLIPVQLICGLVMILTSNSMNELIGSRSKPPQVTALTCWFFLLYLLMATQDIAVDGWAITILSRRNVGWASTCNAVGQALGNVVSFVAFMALNSAEFCNSYLRREPADFGMVSLGGFVSFWGWVFLLTTVAVWLGKSERQESKDESKGYEMVSADEKREEELQMGVWDTYKAMWNVFMKPAVISLSIVLMTSKVGFAAADSVTSLKLQENGLKKERLALLGVVVTPVALILPAVISKYTCGERPLNPFMRTIPYRLAVGLLFVLVLWSMPDKSSGTPVSGWLYGAMLVCFVLHQVVINIMFVSQMAFFARVSDPQIGGTYMTLLNTITNLGAKWPASVVLALVDYATIRSSDGGTIVLDGYYVLSAACTVLGCAWWLSMRGRVRHLEELPRAAWCISSA